MLLVLCGIEAGGNLYVSNTAVVMGNDCEAARARRSRDSRSDVARGPRESRARFGSALDYRCGASIARRSPTNSPKGKAHLSAGLMVAASRQSVGEFDYAAVVA
jgi:hypothetical protein